MKNQKIYERSCRYFKELHLLIRKGIEKISGEKFNSKRWNYTGDLAKEGGGISLSLEHTDNVITQQENSSTFSANYIFEKAGLNYAQVEGKFSPELAKLIAKKINNFKASGVSLVFHPVSPKIPTIHFNLRFFLGDNGICWYGGGVDLTPYFPYKMDFSYFHKQLEKKLNSISPSIYPKYKREADTYFYLPHRKEMRGIGGVFIDYLEGENEENFSIIKCLGDSFLAIYPSIIEKRKAETFTPAQREFQFFRRGRYVEFNLLYDRGTKFGLLSGGRTESIFMSLPPITTYPMKDKFKKYSFVKKMKSYYQPFNWIKD